MTRDELLARLNSIEWNDIEFKEAFWSVPQSALSTVSAFANTEGGYLVFGVTEQNHTFSISGVTNPDKILSDFLGLVRNPDKISVFLPIKEHLHSLPEGTVLVFVVPEATRQQKPVYIEKDPRKAYIRRGNRDDTCTGEELIRFIRDASTTRYDSEPLPDFSADRCFDEGTVRWYRQRHAERNPGRYEQLSDLEFLHQMGCVVEKQHQLIPTRAGILIFGTDAAFRQELTRPVVDFQVYRGRKADYSAEARWADRLTPVPEENLIKTWQVMVAFYTRHAGHPFAIDPGSLRRADDPPDYVSFREAAINLLIHQDFGEQSRWPSIRFFDDQAEFFNPGDAFVSREQLLDPGEKPVRNPSIVAVFRRIGLSDQAGSGVGAIFASWRRLGNIPPVIENQKAEKTFRLILPKERLVSEQQLLARASLGVNLSDQEAAVFAYLTRKIDIDLADIKAITGMNGAGARALAQRLAVEVVLEPVGESGTKFTLAQHLRPRFLPVVGEGGAERAQDRGTVQVTEQVASESGRLVQLLDQLTEVQWQIVEYTDVPRSLTELLTRTGYRQRPFFKIQHVEPLLAGGILRMTIPDKPTSSKQRYVLTEVGVKLKEWRGKQQPGPERMDNNEPE